MERAAGGDEAPVPKGMTFGKRADIDPATAYDFRSVASPAQKNSLTNYPLLIRITPEVREIENIPPEKTETKVPDKGLAVASLACGIVSLACGGTIFAFIVENVWTYACSADSWADIISLADSCSIFILPFMAIIFGAIPLNQGKGTDWDGKGMAEAGLVTGIISVAWMIFCVASYEIGVITAMAPYINIE